LEYYLVTKIERRITIDKEDFFTEYFKYIGESEAPTIYHRWTALSILGANLGRNVWLPFGHSKIYPNQYILLMGPAGARKGTAINPGVFLLRESGYRTFAPDSVSKEMFLAGIGKVPNGMGDNFDLDLETLVEDGASETFVVAGEFNDFMGQGDLKFVTNLTNLWDNLPHFYHPKLTGKDVYIEKPTVNILGGNTQQNFALCIPPEAVGNGFCSRVMFIGAEATGKQITFPEPENATLRGGMVRRIANLREEAHGPLSIAPNAKETFDRIYKKFKPIDDTRFTHYSTRRFTHLLKLCIILATADSRNVITTTDAIRANTVLQAAERRMPKALGEFGRSKNSAATASILETLTRTHAPLTINELWKLVHKDLNKFAELTDIIMGLVRAEKVQSIKIGGKQGYMTKAVVEETWDTDLLDLGYLTDEELD
jgi:hypothetical protein